jgi:hypothetical protein
MRPDFFFFETGVFWGFLHSPLEFNRKSQRRRDITNF